MLTRVPTHNIAHDIREVLPLFHTLESDEFYETPSHIIICWFKDLEIESVEELYPLFSKEPTIIQLHLCFQPTETLTFFENVTIGLLTKST